MTDPLESGRAAAARVRGKVREAGAGYTGFLLLQRLLPDSVRIHRRLP